MKFGEIVRYILEEPFVSIFYSVKKMDSNGVSLTSHPSTVKLLHHSSSWYEYIVMCVKNM